MNIWDQYQEALELFKAYGQQYGTDEELQHEIDFWKVGWSKGLWQNCLI